MQLFRRWQQEIEEFLHLHSGPMTLLSALFIIGIIFGALAIRSLPTRDRLELAGYLSSTVVRLSNPPADTGAVLFKRSLAGNAQFLALLWVLGISVVGSLGVMLVALLQGVLSGFVVAFLAAEMGLSGVLLALSGHLPQTLIKVPALLVAGALSVSFSLQVMRTWTERRRVPRFYAALASYTGSLLLIGLLLLAASLIEAFLTPPLVRLAVNLLKQM